MQAPLFTLHNLSVTDYQNTGDEAVLRQVREVCWPIVEAVLQEKAIDDEQANNLREKGIERFPFIISKYQALGIC